MPNRVFLKIVPNQIAADLLLERLRSAGFPVVGAQPLLPYPDLVSPVELYLLQPEVLDRPGAREELASILENAAGAPLSEADADQIAAMPGPAEPVAESPERPRRKRWWLWVLVAVLAVLAGWMAIPGGLRIPEFGFMKSAVSAHCPAPNREFLESEGLYGGQYTLDQPYAEAVSAARAELLDLGYLDFDEKIRTTFFRLSDSRHGSRYAEMISIEQGQVLDPKSMDYKYDASACTVLWGYRPTVAQRLRGWLRG